MNTRLVHVHFNIHTLNLTGRFGSPVASINTAINVKFLEKDYREQLTHTGLFLACVAGPKRGGVISMHFALPTNPLSTQCKKNNDSNDKIILKIIVHIDYTKTTSSLRLPPRKWEGRENSLKCNIYNNYFKKIITVCKIKELKLY